MSPQIRIQPFVFGFGCALVFVLLGFDARLAVAQAYQPGDVIEYRVRSVYPHQWERGTIVKELPGGTQYLIREKPNQFFPEGFEAAYALADLRRPQADVAPPVAPPGTPGPSVPPPPNAVPGSNPAPQAMPGLLSKEVVIAYARQAMGGDPWGNPQRDAILAQIRDYIKTHGTNFAVDDDFRQRMNAQGTMSTHISWAVDENRGPHPKVSDYLGTWLLRTSNRGSQSIAPDGSTRVIITTTDSQHESGQLTIQPDGNYVWQVSRGDPESQWLRGTWREVRPEELNAWEGGPALWLTKAKQGYDCMVRMHRDPQWPGWIDVGMGAARTPVEYGRRP